MNNQQNLKNENNLKLINKRFAQRLAEIAAYMSRAEHESPSLRT